MAAGADVNKRGMWDNTPLISACEYGHVDVALFLVANGAEVDAVNEHGCSPLLHAAMEGLAPVVKALVAAGANVNAPKANVYNSLSDANETHVPLSAAASRGTLEIVQLLVEHGAGLGAAGSGDVGNGGGNGGGSGGGNDEGSGEGAEGSGDAAPPAPLLCAARLGHTSVVALLLDRRPGQIMWAPEDQASLAVACSKGEGEVAMLLVDHYQKCTDRSSGRDQGQRQGQGIRLDPAVLTSASRQSLDGVVAALLGAGADVNATDDKGSSPLHGCCSGKADNVDLARLLLQHGADATATGMFLCCDGIGGGGVPHARTLFTDLITTRAYELHP